MPLYMTQFAYTPEAWAALAKNPQDRTEAVGGLAKQMGGRLISLYYHFGDYDGTLIYEAPDDVTASATVVAAVAAGHLKAMKTTRLFSVPEALEMMRKAGKISFQAPRK